MASPPIQFDSDPSLMAAAAAPGSNYGGYQNIYAGNMGFSHPGSYAVPSPATPPMHNNGAYAPNGTNFQFSYGDVGSAPPSSSGTVIAAVSAPLATPTGTQPADSSPQVHHPNMANLMHGHAIYPGDGRYDRVPQQRYMDPNMQPMMGRNGSRDMTWAQGGMMPDLLGANHPGGAIRNVAGQQARVPVKPGLGGLNGMGGMMNGMNGLGMGGLAGMPTMGWGGMVGAPTSPYGHNPHAQQALQHPQQFHPMQQNPYQQQQHLMHHQQGMQQHMGMHGRPGGLGPIGGGGISKKKVKKPIIPVVKDKNCPKRPRNSYIFFTLMKRDDIKKKHPEFKPTEITKMLGEEWQKLSEAEKESYGSMAENDKKRYQSEMESYDANGGATGAAAAAAAAAAASEGGIGNGPPGTVGELGAESWRT
ncbi:hypothetical protein BGX27_000935 [Mortierella sp. AM989]|nr:hypothetical protein BGX27_000935 [Mortierella sp. AM989]